MGKKNANWKKVDNYKNPMLIIYSCESAYEEEPTGRFSSFAKKVSIQHPNLTVVGFDGYVDYGQKGMSRISEHLHTGDGNGKIVIYKNGAIIYKGLFKNF
ncbi:hypothetical protein [Chryseobacterium sp. SIMBA_038]|uniref:hypothetical protein n=1 Tax=Chryseobacterium sp. SIMBA_038 TaxID=3085780 RepID=UPI00397B73BB